jgi:hypothetical protein
MTVAGNAFSVGGTTLAVTAGNIGIGTAAPGARLNIYANTSIITQSLLGIQQGGSFASMPGYAAAIQTYGNRDGSNGTQHGLYVQAGFNHQDTTEIARFSAVGASYVDVPKMVIMANGVVGISTATPQAALDIVSSATAVNVQAQIWRNGSGVIVGSMSSTGYLTAVKFVGDGSGLSGTADNLGNHTAIQDLNMSGYSILNATSVYVNAGTLGTVSGSSQTLASLQFSDTNGDKLMAISTRTADGSDWTTAGVMLKRRVDLTDMGYIKFGSQSSDLLTFGRNQSEYVRIDSAGNVGIGNNNPTTKLSVGGTTQVDFDTSNSGKVVIKVGGVAVAEMLPN